MKNHRLLLKQISEKLESYKVLYNLEKPRKGWIFTIRQVLGISSTKLAERLQINQSVMSRLEKSEADSAITLKSLESVAEALDCRLVYALVPKTSLEDIIQAQAKKLAKERIEQVSHHMKLEGQSISKDKQRMLYDELLNDLLSGSPKKLWK